MVTIPAPQNSLQLFFDTVIASLALIFFLTEAILHRQPPIRRSLRNIDFTVRRTYSGVAKKQPQKSGGRHIDRKTVSTQTESDHRAARSRRWCEHVPHDGLHCGRQSANS